MDFLRRIFQSFRQKLKSGLSNSSVGMVKDVENGILRGYENWLFLWDGSNEVHRYYTDPSYFTDSDADDWVALLEKRKTMVEALGAQYRHITIPDKLSIYPQHIPFDLPFPDAHPAALLALRMRGKNTYVDLLPDLKGTRVSPANQVVRTESSLPGTEAFFIKTDSHWTFEGCQIGYLRLCESLGVVPWDFSDRRAGPGRVMAFDLGKKLTPPVTEHGRFVPVMHNSRRINDNNMVRYNEAEGFVNGTPRFVGCNVHNHNDHPDVIPQTVVLFGDSFSEFRPTMLTAMLSETFRDVHFVWSTNIDEDYIKKVSPDIVVTEIAERFSKRLPTDEFRVPE